MVVLGNVFTSCSLSRSGTFPLVLHENEWHISVLYCPRTRIVCHEMLCTFTYFNLNKNLYMYIYIYAYILNWLIFNLLIYCLS